MVILLVKYGFLLLQKDWGTTQKHCNATDYQKNVSELRLKLGVILGEEEE